MADRPSGTLIAAAMRCALARRRALSTNDPRFAAVSAAAIAERVTGVVVPVRQGHDGWWRIGAIVDDLAEGEWAVWVDPRRRRLRLVRTPAPPVEEIAPTPRPDGRYFDGFRRRWVQAGAATPDESESTEPA
ncbi:MAG: hypothetical protein IT337_02365 [Thermomicrobiales bacterium]|nr:hypothetical protein [Thermomicrobiales bacterium]